MAAMNSMNSFFSNVSMRQVINLPPYNNMEIKEPPPQPMQPQMLYPPPVQHITAPALVVPPPPPSPPKPIPMANPYCQTLKTFPAHKHHRVTSQPDMVHKTRSGGSFNPQMSLEFLRCTLQRRINKDIQKVFQHYAQYFQLAVDNIRENHGDDSVSDDHVLTVYRNSLEAAKEAFMPHGKIYKPEFVQAHGDGLHYRKKIKKEKLWSDSPQGSPASIKDQSEGTTFSMRPVPNIQTRKRKGRPPVHHKDYTDEIPTSGSSGYKSTKVRTEFVRREGPKWDPARLTLDSLFVMGAKANKALGLGATRGRLYIKHPDLFKYSGDSDDKQWLYEHQLMPATGGKAYMLLLGDIRDLAQSDEYRCNDGLLMDQLRGFHVPDHILVKMKRFMEETRTDGSQGTGVGDDDPASSDCAGD